MQIRAQGATEYLVLLAVVLIVALVSVALLGFFPGMASDAQLTQSQMYWKSASPIAITDLAVRAISGMGSGANLPYMQVKNVGAYPIRITKLVSGTSALSLFYGYADAACGLPASGLYNISDFFYLAPGEEKYFNYDSVYKNACERIVKFDTGASSSYSLPGAASICANSNSSPGYVAYETFGFEYIEYIDSQQITKRQIGKELNAKCREPT